MDVSKDRKTEKVGWLLRLRDNLSSDQQALSLQRNNHV
jgi:hypothetical protein